MSAEDEQHAIEEEGPPPIAGSWRRLYSLLLVYLAALIVTLYAITLHFR